MNTIQTFVVVDDDLLNNRICTLMIDRTLGGTVKTNTFSSPEAALTFIQKEYAEGVNPTVLLLDINMPTMNGWEFMEQYAGFDKAIQEQIFVYIVSSSVDWRDKEKAEANPLVKGFIPKPLESDMIVSLVKG